MPFDSFGKTFRPDYRIATLSALGILGFIMGGIFLFYPDLMTITKKDSIFHEVLYSPQRIMGGPLTYTIDSLTRKNEQRDSLSLRLAALETKFNMPASPTPLFDSLHNAHAHLQMKIDQDNNNIKVLQSYHTYAWHGAWSDTNSFKRLNAALRFDISPDTIDEWERRYKRGDTAFLTRYSFRDTGLSFSIDGAYTFKVVRAKNDVGFISKYPAAGVWLLSIMIFCSFCLIAASTCAYLNSKTISIFRSHQIEGLSPRSYYIGVGIILVVLLFLYTFWKLTYYDEEVIKNLYFLRTLRVSMDLVTLLGYICGAFCLAGFIRTASLLGYFAGSIKDATRKIRLAPADDSVTKDEEERRQAKAIYDRLLEVFNTYFLLTAIILTLLVLCTGGLFSTTSSFNFIKLLADDWGRSPARPDFIYLYGGIHTILLLLFYIPAKMRFNEINIAEPAASPAPGAINSKWQDFFKVPLSQVKELLVVASPVLAGLLQAFFDMFFK